MWDGLSAGTTFKQCGITDVVWIPDSQLGQWENALDADDTLRLLRVCREGEAFALAAGLLIGGRNPLVVMQCTGLFEAGDSLRNFVHDLRLPLFFLVGVRSYYAHQEGTSKDTCPVFTEPILRAWNIPYAVLTGESAAVDFERAYRDAKNEQRAGAALLAE